MPLVVEITVRHFIAAIFSGLWEGLALTALIGAVVWRLPRANAASRFLVWWLTLAVVVALPLVNLLQWRPEAKAPEGGVGAPELNARADTSAARVKPVAPPSAAAPPSAVASGAPAASKLAMSASWPGPSALAGLLRWSRTALIVWLAGSLALLARVAWSWVHLARLKRKSFGASADENARFERCAARLHLRRSCRLAVSADVTAPVLAGLGAPMVLLPRKLFGEFSESEREQVMLHELAHLRRWDDWTNLAERLLGAVFFFHPAVRWLGRQLRLEREIACDDWVLTVAEEPKPYALFLIRLAELLAAPKSSALAPGIWFDHAQLSQRIAKLLNPRRNASTRTSIGTVAGTVATLALAATVVIVYLPQAARAAGAVSADKPAEKSGDDAAASDKTVESGTRSPRQRDRAEAGIKALRSALDRQEERVRTLQEGVDLLRRNLGIPAAIAESDNGAANDPDASRKIEMERIAAESQWVELKTMFDSLSDKHGKELKRAVMAAFPYDPVLPDLLKEAAATERQLAETQPDLGSQNPKVKRIADVSNVIDRQIDEQLEGLLQGLEARVKAAKMRLDHLAKMVDQARKEATQNAIGYRPYFEAKHLLEIESKFRDVLRQRLLQEAADVQLSGGPGFELVNEKRQLLNEEIKLIQERLKSLQEPGAVFDLRRELLRCKRELLEL